MNTVVKFSIARLLKEKGFKDRNVLGTIRLSESKYYDPAGIIHEIKDAFEKTDYDLKDCFNAPTIGKVIMWLYEKYGIWIYSFRVKNYGEVKWYYTIETTADILLYSPTLTFNNPVEAFEAGIEYALTTLI